MLNKNDKKEDEMLPYGIEEEKMRERAEENLKANKEYQKLRKQLDKLNMRTDLVQVSIVKARMRQMVEYETDRLIDMEMKNRKCVKGVSRVLKEKDMKEYDEWQEVLASLSFSMDMIDYAVAEINDILKRNDTGIKLEDFDEIKKARKLVQRLVGEDIINSEGWHQKLWIEECDRLWEHMRNRCEVYRRKVYATGERERKKKQH